ncbi:PREDICTED: disintegrin and metalloproteinase domain-containing protein 8-like, partial [Bison bison bison]|uniref:Disintegrin and metalloproteinase domain-containing protein 8-like n=1 Tax=Bison bison bison TaxID=43346 RepID=A0A6P3IQ86_BISBB
SRAPTPDGSPSASLVRGGAPAPAPGRGSACGDWLRTGGLWLVADWILVIASQKWSEPRETRYVELFVVTDSKEFQRFGSREAVRQRVLEVVNHVDKLYQELNFRVVLVGLEMWNGGDKIQISSQPDATLDNFLAWRTRELVGRQAHDNVQLIT